MPLLSKRGGSPATSSSRLDLGSNAKNPRLESPLATSTPRDVQRSAQDSPFSLVKELHGPRASLATFATLNRRETRAVVPKSFPPTALTPEPSISASYHGETMNFMKIMEHCGIKLGTSAQQAAEISQCSAEIVLALTKLYEESIDKHSFLDTVIDGFDRYIRNPAQLQSALMPTSILVAGENGTNENMGNSTENCVVRILLSVDAFQHRVTLLLVDKLESLLKRWGFGGTSQANVGIAKTILDQFRYLDTSQAGLDACLRFLDLVPNCNDSLKVEIFSLLPQFIDDSGSAAVVAERLEELMERDTTVLRFALKTLSELPLPMEKFISLRDAAVNGFQNYGPEEKVAALKFILETAEATGDVDQVFGKIMPFNYEIYFEDDAKRTAATSGQRSQSASNAGMASLAAAVADVLENALKNSKTVADAAIRFESANKLKDGIFNVFLILAMFSAKRGRQAVALVRQKVRSKYWTMDLLDACFQYPEVMALHVRSLLEIADDLISAREKLLTTFGTSMYQRLFVIADDAAKQDITASLVVHVRSGQELEANAAIDTLDLLASTNSLGYSAMLLLELLDALTPLKLYQIRKVFALFGRLAFNGDDIVSVDELHIFVRKTMDGGSLWQRAVGIISALTLFKAGQSEMKERWFQLFEIANDCSKEHDTLRKLFCDELSNAIQSGEVKEVKLVENLKKETFDVLESKFVQKFDKKNSEDVKEWKRLLQTGSLVGASENEPASIALKLPMEPEEGSNNKGFEANAAILPSLLRLFVCCEWRLNGNFDNIDLLLKSPIILRYRSNWSKMAQLQVPDQSTTCMELMHCGNCLIELINGLSKCGLEENNFEIALDRLKHLVELEEELERCLHSSPSVILPTKDCFLEPNDLKTARNAPLTKKPAANRKKNAKKNGGGKATQPTLCSDMLQQVLNSSTTQKSTQSPNGDTETGDRTKDFKPGQNDGCFRALDLTVFNVLKLGSNNHDEQKLTSDVLAYLLSKMASKIHGLTMSSSPKRGGIFVNKNAIRSEPLNAAAANSLKEQLRKSVSEIWKHVLHGLDHFKELTDTSDGIVDNRVSLSRDSSMIARCVELGLDCISEYFKWSTENETRSVTLRVLESISDDGIRSSQMEIDAMLRSAVNRLLEYSECIPTLNLAVAVLKAASNLVSLYGTRTHASEDDLKIAKIADGYLQREWDLDDTTASGINTALVIALDLAMSIPAVPERLAMLKCYTEAVAVIFTKKSAPVAYRLIKKSTLFTWYRMVFTRVASEAKASPLLTRISTEAQRLAWLQHWATIGACFRLLSTIVKNNISRQICSACLVQSCATLNAFTTKAVPSLEHSLKNGFDLKNIKDLFAAFKVASIAVNDICVTAKVTMPALLKMMPRVKRALEAYVFRVKAMMAANDCVEALRIGLLKNKDLQGIIHSSQASQRSNDDEEEEVEEGGIVDQEQADAEDGYQEDVGDVELDKNEENEAVDDEESEDGSVDHRTTIASDRISEAY